MYRFHEEYPVRPCDKGNYIHVSFREKTFRMTSFDNRSEALHDLYMANSRYGFVPGDDTDWEDGEYKRSNPIFEGVVRIEPGSVFYYENPGHSDFGDGYEIVLRTKDFITLMRKHAGKTLEFVPFRKKPWENPQSR